MRLQALERQISAYSENRFLRYPGMLVSTVEILGYEPVFGRISRKIGVEKIDRNSSRSGLVMHPNHVMLPYAHLHVSTFEPYGYLERKRFHERTRVEVGVYLFLLPKRAYILNEVAALVEKRYGDQRDVQVGSRFDVVPGQNAKPSAVGRNAFI